jgi:hypothetical protein
MKKIATFCALAGLLSLASCAAGPQQLTRTVDDWDREMYVQEPLIDGVLYVVPVIPIARYAAMIGDFLVVNAYHFWFHDVWDGKGTNFVHAEVASTDGELKSLMMDGAKFLMND